MCAMRWKRLKITVLDFHTFPEKGRAAPPHYQQYFPASPNGKVSKPEITEGTKTKMSLTSLSHLSSVRIIPHYNQNKFNVSPRTRSRCIPEYSLEWERKRWHNSTVPETLLMNPMKTARVTSLKNPLEIATKGEGETLWKSSVSPVGSTLWTYHPFS